MTRQGPVARDRDIDVLEIVLAGTAYDEGVFGHSLSKLSGVALVDKRTG